MALVSANNNHSCICVFTRGNVRLDKYGLLFKRLSVDLKRTPVIRTEARRRRLAQRSNNTHTRHFKIQYPVPTVQSNGANLI